MGLASPIEMNQHMSTIDLQYALRDYPKYQLTEAGHDVNPAMEAPESEETKS